jgi:streptogramin lyase
MMGFPFKGSSVVGAGLAGLIVVASGFTDVNRYFNIQMHDASVFMEHSTGATYVARSGSTLAPDERMLVDDRLIGEPTLQFIDAGQRKPEAYKSYLLPLTQDVPTAIFLGGDLQNVTRYVQSVYPNAKVSTFTPPYGGPPLISRALVDQAEISRIRGVDAHYQPEGAAEPTSRREQSLAISLASPPVSFPFSATWSASIVAPLYGDYGFKVQGAPDDVLSIDQQVIGHGGAAIQVSLPRGVHHLELQAHFDSERDVEVLWQPPNARELEPVPPQVLFTPPNLENGLLARYYSNTNWTGPAAVEEIDPFVSYYFQEAPVPLPFTVEWSGQIAAPISGVYGFNSTSIDGSQVFIDDKLVVNSGSNSPAPGSLTLDAGFHSVRVRLDAHSGHNHIEFLWQPPGRPWDVVPATFLLPGKGVGSAQPLPELPPPPAVAAASGPPGAQPIAASQVNLPLDWQAGMSDLVGADSIPAGAAVDPAGNVYTVDTTGTVLKLASDGKLVWSAKVPAVIAEAQQMAGLALTPDGSVLTLDSSSGTVARVLGDGHFDGLVGKNLDVYHPRGLAVGPEGDIYLADTGRGRVLHLNPSGSPVGELGTHGAGKGQLDQPSGVAVSKSGDILVVDPGAKKVARFASSGGVIREWPFPDGPTAFGPQLAVGSNDDVWGTDTSGGRLLKYAADGATVTAYGLPGGLSSPSALALGSDSVVVAEPGLRRLDKLAIAP